eukprot:2914679-Rhodomonas_salina.1
MWQWLHEAAKYSEKALSIISHTMANKGQPLFATNVWKAIVLRFNPANAKNAAMQDAAMKLKINSFAGRSLPSHSSNRVWQGGLRGHTRANSQSNCKVLFKQQHLASSQMGGICPPSS